VSLPLVRRTRRADQRCWNLSRTILGIAWELTGDGAGAQVVLWPRKKVVEQEVVEAAALRGVGIYGMAHCWLGRPARPAFILGYACLNEQEIREGIRVLASIL